MASLICCAQCCTIFSITGLVFLLIIGSLLQKQPLYIKGIDDSAKGAQACYQGALIYLGTFLLSLAYWILYAMKQKVSSALSGDQASQRKKFGGTYGALVSDNQ